MNDVINPNDDSIKVDEKMDDVNPVDEKMDDVKPWSIDNIYRSELTVDTLIQTLQVIDVFKRKYPNDEIVRDFEEIVRDEICMIFGGSLYKD